VELRPLGRRSVTDANGLYTFRDLPSGEYTIVAMHKGQERNVPFSVPDGPTFMKDMDVALVPAADVVIGGPLLAKASHAPATAPTERIDGPEPRHMKTPTADAAFTIHVAASTNARHARAMVNELRNAGHAAYLVESAAAGPGGYQVRVGPYSTLADADRSARTLEQTLGRRLRVTARVAPHGATDVVVQARAVSYR
jgi:cell division septation protein DedD